MGGAVRRRPRPARALTGATLPYALKIANLGAEEACRRDPALMKGLNTYNGKLTCFSINEAGQYTTVHQQEHIIYDPALPLVAQATAPVLTATAAPTAVATVKPTNTPKPTAKPVEDDGRISKGDTGYDVRKM